MDVNHNLINNDNDINNEEEMQEEEEQINEENENDNVNINNEEEEDKVEKEIVLPSNELNKEIEEQHDKNQQIEEEGEGEDVNQEKLNELKEEIENLTDSDIDDPKYKPYNNNPKNIDNDLFKMQQKINFLERNNNFMNKTLIDFETENKILKSEISKKNEILRSKEDLTKEYQNLFQYLRTKLIKVKILISYLKTKLKT